MPAGTRLKPLPLPGTQFLAKYDGQAAFSGTMREARGLFGSGRYLESLRKYQSIREIAQRQGDLDHVARATGNIGGCQFALHQYQPALRAFQEARRLALAAGDTGVAAVFEGNIASLYTELGNLDAAAQWMKDSLARVSGQDRLEHLAQLQIQMATLLARQKKSQAAWQYFRQGNGGRGPGRRPGSVRHRLEPYRRGVPQRGRPGGGRDRHRRTKAPASGLSTAPKRPCWRPTGCANCIVWLFSTIPTAIWAGCAWRKATWPRPACCWTARWNWPSFRKG